MLLRISADTSWGCQSDTHHFGFISIPRSTIGRGRPRSRPHRRRRALHGSHVVAVPLDSCPLPAARALALLNHGFRRRIQFCASIRYWRATMGASDRVDHGVSDHGANRHNDRNPQPAPSRSALGQYVRGWLRLRLAGRVLVQHLARAPSTRA